MPAATTPVTPVKYNQKHTLLYVSLIGTAVSLIILGMVAAAYRSFYLTLRENIIEMGRNDLKNASSKFADYLNKNLNFGDITGSSLNYLLTTGASEKDILEFLDAQSRQYQKDIAPSLSTLYGYFRGHYLDPDTWERDETYNPKSRPWYTNAVAGEGKTVASPPYRDAETKGMVSSICKLLKDNESVISFDIPLDNLNDVMSKLQSNKHGYGFAFHTNGYIIAHKDKREIGKNYFIPSEENNVDLKSQRARAAFLKRIISEHDAGSFTTTLEDKTSIVITARINRNWHIGIVIYQSRIEAAARNILASNAIIIFGGIILILVFVIICFIRMVKANAMLATSQELLREERDRVISAEKARSLFFAAVSHDIRTPLNAILGFSELLKMGVEDEETRQKYLDSVVFNGKTLAELINDILDLSKLDADKMSFTFEKVNCFKLVEALMMSFNLKASQENVELISDLPQTLPHFMLDPYRIRQILFNLLGNAVKFTHQGSITLKIAYTPKDADTCDLMFAVKDTGIGIAPENIAKLAQPFSQFGDAKHSSIGTGLGLSICKQMIEKMNGEFHIESEIGKGSTFSFVLHGVTYYERSITARDITINEKERNAVLAEKANWKLLLVDDSPVNLKVLNAMCRKLGFNNIVQSSDGLSALELMQKEHVDLVLTDMWMPKMNGEELAKAIRQDDNLKSIPVYAVTADVDAQKDYAAQGFTGIILKPITVARLQELFMEASKTV